MRTEHRDANFGAAGRKTKVEECRAMCRCSGTRVPANDLRNESTEQVDGERRDEYRERKRENAEKNGNTAVKTSRKIRCIEFLERSLCIEERGESN